MPPSTPIENGGQRWRAALHAGSERRHFGRVAALVGGLGLSFGFIGVVFAIAYESYASRPDGVRPNDYVTLGRRETESGLFSGVSTADFEAIKSRTPDVAWAYAAFYTEQGEVVVTAGVPQRVDFRRVSGNLLSLLGVAPVLGGVASRDGETVAVLGADLWRGRFAGDPDVVGQTVAVDGLPVPIVGVADPAFQGLFESPPDLWVLDGGPRVEAGTVTIRAGLYMLGALHEDLTHGALASLLAEHRFPFAAQRYDRVEIVPGLEFRPDARIDVRQRLEWLTMVVALLLALAFVVLVDFLAADHAVREDGQAVRLAIGATPGDVFREGAARHAKHGLSIGGIGLAAFLYISDLLVGMDPFASALGKLGSAATAFGFGTSMALLAIAFLWSCWLTAGVVARKSLVPGRTVGRIERRSRLAWMALLFMTAASLLLSVSIGRRFVAESQYDLGFAHTATLMLGVLYANGPTLNGPRKIRETLLADPTVMSAARSEMLPLLPESIAPRNRVRTRGHPALTDTVFYRNRIDGAFFDVLGVRLLAGTLLDPGQPGGTVLSRTAALLIGNGIEDAVGMVVEWAPAHASDVGDVSTVVGVVEDVPYGGLAESPKPVAYTALGPDAAGLQDFWLVRHEGHEDSSDDIVAMLHRLGGGIEEVYRIATPSDILSEQFEKRSVDLALAMACAFAFALAVASVASALVRAVASQAGQVGVRYALGATQVDETWRLASDALTDLLFAGAVLCSGVLVGRLFAPALVAVVTLPLVAGVLAVVAGVCVLGSYLSVRRLARHAAIVALASR